MNSGGESRQGFRERTAHSTPPQPPQSPQPLQPPQSPGPVTPGALLPLHRECTPTDWYIRRIPWRRSNFPSPVPDCRPFTRAELTRLGVSRATLRDRWVSVDYGMFIRDEQQFPETSSSTVYGRRIHPATLVLAHLIRHPRRIATSFAAAVFYGMRYFVDGEQLEFLTPKGTRRSACPPHVILYPTRYIERHRAAASPVLDDRPDLLRTDPRTTLSRMLRRVSVPDATRDRCWQVPDLSTVRPGFTREFLRCVQVSDAFHQALGATVVGSPAALGLPGGVDATDAARVLGYTDVGAESPPETVLRLAVGDLAPGLHSQVPVFRDDGTLLTTSDLAWEDRGLHLFYDGVHHLRRAQRDHDSRVLAVLQRDGGRVLRVTAGDLRDVRAVAALRRRVAVALG